MSHDDTVPSSGPAAEHSVAVPGGTIYYRTEGSGPPLVLLGGGPSNADTLAALAVELAPSRTYLLEGDRSGAGGRSSSISNDAWSSAGTSWPSGGSWTITRARAVG